MQRVPVISANGKPLMPTTASRARRWLKNGKAKVFHNDLGVFAVQLLVEASGEKTQSISLGLDPGKLFSGIGIQSAKSTLWTAHLILPFKTVTERMEHRRVRRRARRGRRINRKLPYPQRCHRQKRFDNRRKGKLPPSIKSNKLLEQRVVTEACKLFPINAIHVEIVETRGSKSFSPVMVGQKQQIAWLSQLAPVKTHPGWHTANGRELHGLEKSKNKAEQTAASHAVDGVVLASFEFCDYQKWYSQNARGAKWFGEVAITSATFTVIRRPPVSRRQLHLCVPAQGGKRRKYGGTVTRHGFRKGDLVRAEKAGKTFIGWCSGDTVKQVSVSDINWKRLGQFTASKVVLLQRSTGLLCKQETTFVGATV